MTSVGWGRPHQIRILLFALATAATLCHARPAPAAPTELTIIRIRPVPIPFIKPSGDTVRRIVHYMVTVEKDGARDLCARMAEVKSILLVNSFNRRLTGDDWTGDLTALTRDLFLAIDPLIGKARLGAMHLALDSVEAEQERKQSKNQIQKRLEQVEDCTTVRTLPPGTITVTRADAQAKPAAPVASAPPQSVVTSAGGTPTPADSALPQAATGPFVTHPQMIDKQESEIRMGKTLITGTSRKGKPGKCNFEVTDLWQSRWVLVNNVPMWIERVFTVDADANEKVDDVAFILKRENGVERKATYLDLHPPGANVNIMGLTLPDPEVIQRLCTGSQEFEPPSDPTKAPSGLKLPNLASEVANRFKSEEQVAKEEQAKAAVPEPSGASTLWRWIAAGISFLAAALAAAVLAYFAVKARRDRRGGADRRGKERRRKDAGREEGERRGDDRRGGTRRASSGRRDDDEEDA